MITREDIAPVDYDSQRQTTWQDLDCLEMALAGLHADVTTFIGRVELQNDINRIRAAADSMAELVQKLQRADA